MRVEGLGRLLPGMVCRVSAPVCLPVCFVLVITHGLSVCASLSIVFVFALVLVLEFVLELALVLALVFVLYSSEC